MEKYLIHSNELHLIDAGKIHQAVEKMVESLDLAAGSTSNFDLYQVVESYFKDLEKRRKINHVLGIKEDRYVCRRLRHQIKKKFSNHTRQFVHIKRESLTEVKLSRFSIYLIVISFPDAR
jgi:hypothetical protein